MCKETRVSPEIVGINHFSIQFKRHRVLLFPDMVGNRDSAVESREKALESHLWILLQYFSVVFCSISR